MTQRLLRSWTRSGTHAAPSGWIDADDLPSGGDGGSVPTNWCRFNLATAPALNLGQQGYYYAQSDLSIAEQSDTDFTVGSASYVTGTSGAILSATGGKFQAAIYFGQGTMTPDGSSDALRWQWLGFNLGPNSNADPNYPVTALGFDDTLPILPTSTDSYGYIAKCAVSTIGYVEPGGAVVFSIGTRLIGAVGTDSYVPDNVGPCLVWQVG